MKLQTNNYKNSYFEVGIEEQSRVVGNTRTRFFNQLLANLTFMLIQTFQVLAAE
jgi:hypothetical protein